MINGAESKFNDYEVRVIGQIIPEIFKKPNLIKSFLWGLCARINRII